MSDQVPLFPYYEDDDRYDPSHDRFPDLHIYTGSWCNRQCGFCIVYGAPTGWYRPIHGRTLGQVMELIRPTGNVKFYGGEPTLDWRNTLRAIGELRKRGFRGSFTLFSNGIRAARVIEILRCDPQTRVVLNFSILHGDGVPPIPPAALEGLTRFARENPNRVFSSHPDIVPIGRGCQRESATQRGDFGRQCARCRPVVTTRGVVHACPFAVEFDRPHYRLGTGAVNGREVQKRYRWFLEWVEAVLEPAAVERNIHPCQVCHQHLIELPTYMDR